MDKKLYVLYGSCKGECFSKVIYVTPMECVKQKRVLTEVLMEVFQVKEEEVLIYDTDISETMEFKKNNLSIIVDKE